MVIDRKENIKAANSVTFGLFYKLLKRQPWN